MRPLRLELSGFGSFRAPTVIDFEGADYFVLVGATGSGKSTIIDGICFALYGSVPRYEHKGLVAPVVTQGQVEARVSLEFEVEGRRYRAVRVVSKRGRNATTKARLELGEDVLAGTADELTAKVSELLGLSFEHFIQCVVLPQGEFARFLKEDPSKRQAMLRDLLGIGVYRQMMESANSLASECKGEAAGIENRLEEDDLMTATPEALAEAKAQVKALEGLDEEVRKAQPELDRLRTDNEGALTELTRTRERLDALTRLSVPTSVSELGPRLQEARDAVATATMRADAASEAAVTATEVLVALGDKTAAELTARAYAHRETSVERLETALKAQAAATEAQIAAQASAEAARAALAEAESANEAARAEHQAQHLASGLELGQPCPVCLQEVARLPRHPKATALDKSAAAVAKAVTARDKADAVLAERDRAVTQAETTVKMAEEQLAEIEAALTGQPDLKAIETSLSEIAAAEASLAQARAADKQAREAQALAQKTFISLSESETNERHRFEETRDALTQLGPPTPRRSSLLADWQELVEWSKGKLPELQHDAQQLEEAAGAARAAQMAVIEKLAQRCVECDLEPDDDDLTLLVTRSLDEARAEVKAVSAGMAKAKALRAKLDEVTKRQQLAAALGRHLNATGFERWLIGEALHRLVAGATKILRELSQGQYSLTVDGTNNFLVTDHHNANETRPAKTLSGGETFLASLSLALALSDQLIELQSQGSARLDAIFLDEGFGTLDPEALDMVAATVENLSSAGRMVGIVTHVRDLADRVPLQFRVSKDSRTSKVERTGG